MQPGQTIFRLIRIAVLTAAVALIVIFYKGLFFDQHPEPEAPMPAPGAKLPQELGKVDPRWILRTLDGKDVPWQNLQGKVVFLNIWATWCPPCVAELPGIQSLADRLGGDQVVFALVSSQDAQEIRDFASRHKITLPLYTAGTGVPRVFATEYIPATFIINPQGEVAYKHVGGKDWDTEETRTFLRSLR
jgi:thiol-disulfide isomerase/thioredoxin